MELNSNIGIMGNYQRKGTKKYIWGIQTLKMKLNKG